MNNIFIAFLVGTLIFTGIFIAVPYAPHELGFSGEKFWSGDSWRILTFPLVHVSTVHLLENLFALFVVSLLAYELSVSLYEFLGMFVVANLGVAFFTSIALPTLVIAGASLGIYSIFGSLALKGSKFIPIYASLGIFALVIFLNILYTLFTNQSVVQPLFHASGFMVGAGLFKIKEMTPYRTRRKL